MTLTAKYCLILISLTMLLGFATSISAATQPETLPKVLVMGLDGMDPVLLEQFLAEGVMPRFQEFLAQGGQLESFGTAIPPQSPVAKPSSIVRLIKIRQYLAGGLEQLHHRP